MGSRFPTRDAEAPGWNVEFSVWDCFDWAFGREGFQMSASIDPHKRDLERRFESIGWGLLFLLFGALALPNGTTEYAAAAVLGGALVALNVARAALDLEIAWFGAVLGLAFLIGGLGALGGIHMDVFVLFFAIAGLATIVAAVVRPNRRKATEQPTEA
jgi:hypothetical protein